MIELAPWPIEITAKRQITPACPFQRCWGNPKLGQKWDCTPQHNLGFVNHRNRFFDPRDTLFESFLTGLFSTSVETTTKSDWEVGQSIYHICNTSDIITLGDEL